LPWIGTVPNAVSLRHLLVGSRDEKEPYLLAWRGSVAIEVAHRRRLRLVGP
jgi:hypothetical protein